MIQLDLSDHRPLYEQIKERFKELIINGILRPDDKLPSVRELAQQLTINPNTIQRAYKDMETEGYIYSVRAKGSFVAPIEQIIRKSEKSKLMEDFENIVRQAHFVGIPKERMIEVIHNIFEEVQND